MHNATTRKIQTSPPFALLTFPLRFGKWYVELVETLSIPLRGEGCPKDRRRIELVEMVRFTQDRARFTTRAALLLCTLLLSLLMPHRTYAQPTNGMAATSVLGQPNFTNTTIARAQGLASPYGIAIDNANGKIYVADPGNNRVLRYSRAQALTTAGTPEAVFGQTNFISNASNSGGVSGSTMNSPIGIAVDSSGNLYVSDYNNHRVLRFNSAHTANSGATASAVFGQANMNSNDENRGGGVTPSQSSLRYPFGIAIDRLDNLYIVDQSNNRVLRFANASTAGNGPNASAVFGQSTFSTNTPFTTATGLDMPKGVTIDASFNLYVAQQNNNRVVRYANAHTASNGSSASAVFGQPNETSFTANNGGRSASRMSVPIGVAVDIAGNLFVAEQGNHRVMRFANASTATTGAAANLVYGQPDFTSAPTAGVSNMYNPQLIAVDPLGNLYVGDYGANRILIFANGTSATMNNPTPSSVLGQGNLNSGTANASFEGALNTPTSIAVDNTTGKIFVAETGNNRVVRYSSVQALLTGGTPEAVLGQSVSSGAGTANQGMGAFNNGAYTPSASSMSSPNSIVLDNAGNLYVADASNNRVLRFANALTASTGASASAVFGQAGFTTNGTGTSLSSMNLPYGVTVDASGNLYIADAGNNRVLRINNAASASNGVSATEIGSGFNSPYDVAIDASNNLYIVDYNNNQVVRLPNAHTANTATATTASLGGPSAGPSAASATVTNYPTGVAVDSQGNLYVADQNYHRVLRYSNAATIASGTPADLVLGQANFTSGDANRGGSAANNSLSSPADVTIDASGNMFVADNQNNRVLRFVGFGSASTSATASPTSVNFGTNFTGGLTTTQTITLSIANVNANDSFTYTLGGNTTGITLSENGFTTTANTNPFNRTFTLTLNPAVVNTVSGFLYIRSAGVSTTLATITLGGQVRDVTSLTVSATSVNHGTVNINATSTQTIRLTINNAIAGERFTYSSNSADFTLGSNTSFTTSATSTQFTTTVTISFAPTTIGAKTGNLTISTASNVSNPTVVALSGTAVSTSMTVSASSMNFGTINTSNTSTQTIVLTLSNVQAGERFTYASNSADFALGTNLGFTTTASSTQFTTTITVSFAPTTIGAKTGNLTISTANSVNATIIAMSGTAVSTSLTVSAVSLNFGAVGTNATASTQTITLTINNAQAGERFTYSTTGTNASDFLLNGNLGFTTTASSTQFSTTITVGFVASNVGNRTGNLVISTASSVNTTTIPLAGIGLNSTSATPSPAVVSFGTNFTGGGTTTQTVVLTMVNVSANDVFTYSLGGNTTGITMNTTGFTTTANASQFSTTITLTLNPATVNVINGVLWVNSAGVSNTLATITLGGQVRDVTSLTVSPTSLNHGTTNINATSTQTIRLTINNGMAGERFTYASNSADFVLGTNTVFTTNATSTQFSTSITVSFSPTSVGAKTGNLTISTASNVNSTVVALSGTAVSTSLTVSASSLNFGTLNTSNTSTQTITLTLTNVQAGERFTCASNSADFTLGTNTGFTTTASSTQFTTTITMSFAPTAIGARTGNLTISTASSVSTPTVIAMSGTAISTSLTISATSLNFGAVGTNATASTQTITLTINNAQAGERFTYSTTGTNASDFSLSGNLGFTTTASSTQFSTSITVGFVASNVGNRTGNLVISTASSVNNTTIPLTGIGLNTTSATANPTSVSFGTNFVGGATTTQTVTLNIINVNNGDTFNYTFGGNTTGVSVSPTSLTTNANASQFNQTITLSLNPTAVNTVNGVMWVNSTQSGSTTLATIALSGAVLPVATLTVSPTSIAYGSVPRFTPTQSRVITLTFNNIRAGEAITVSLPTNPSNVFTVNSTTQPITFTTNANQSVFTTTVTLSLQASALANTYNGVLRTAIAGNGTATSDIALSATLSELTVNVTPNPVSFGSIAAIGVSATQTSSTQTLTMTWSNAVAGTTQLTFSTTGSAFSYSSDATITLQGTSGTSTIALAFRPTVVGTSTGTLRIVGNAAGLLAQARQDEDDPIDTPRPESRPEPLSKANSSTIQNIQNQVDMTVNLTGIATFAIPSAPVATAGTSITTTSFVANWNASGGATSYAIDIATNEGFTNLVVNNVSVNTTSYTFTGGSANTTYFIRVRASNAQGTSGNSNTIQVLTLPNAPQNLTSTSIGASSATLTWSAPIGGASSYALDVSTTSALTSFVGSFNNQSISGLTVPATGLQQGITYFWRVRAVNATGTSANSSVQSFTTLFAPVLTSFTPNPIAQGQTLTLVGNFFASPMTVNIGGTVLTAVVVNASTATVIIPNTVSGIQSVSITTPGGSATNSQLLTIIAPPTVTSVTPNSILVPSAPTSFTIVGTNFTNATLTLTGPNSVNGINIASSITSSSTTQFVVNLANTLLANAGRYTLTVTNLAGSASGIVNVNLPPPTIADLQPRVFAVGQTVTITGTNFIGASVVTLGGVNLSNFTVVNANTITAVVSGAPSGSVVTVQTGSGTARAEFTYIFVGAPTLSIDPSRLPITPIVTNRQPVVLTLNGSNMIVPGENNIPQAGMLTLTRPDGGTFALNSVVLNPFALSLSSTQIQLAVPFDQLQNVGTYTIALTTAGGSASRTVNVVQDQFGVSGTIQRTDQPNSGTDMSGIVVTLSGNGLQPRIVQTSSAGAYSFGDVPIGTYTVSYSSTRFFIDASSRTVAVQGTTVIPNPIVVRLQAFNISGIVTTGTSINSIVLPNPEVNYTNTNGTIVGRTLGNSAGFFLIGGLPAGQYYLTIASTIATFNPIVVTIGDRDVVIDGNLLRGNIINRNTSASTSVAVQGSANIGTVTDEFRNVPSTAGNLTVIVTRTPDFGDLVLTTRPTVNVVMNRERGYEPIVLVAESLGEQSITNEKRGSEISQVSQERLLRLGDTVSLTDVQSGRVVYRPRVTQTQTDTIRFNINYNLGSNTIVNSVVTVRFNVAQRPPRIVAQSNLPEVIARAGERPGVQWFVSDIQGNFDFAGIDSAQVTSVVSSNEGLLPRGNITFNQFNRGRWLMTMQTRSNTTGTTVITVGFVVNFNGFTEATTQSVRLTITPASSVVLPIGDVVQTISPNPASEEVQIRFASKRSEDTKVSMVNMLGQTVMIQTAPRGSEAIMLNIRTLPSGTYRVVMQDSRGIATQQVVVVR